MVCSDCKYPYVPSSGKCPSCGHQNLGDGWVLWIFILILFILFLPVFLIGIGLYSGSRKLKYVFGWILVAYFIYSVIDGFNKWLMYEGFITILKDYAAIGYVLNIIGLIFGIVWISKGYKTSTQYLEEQVVEDEEGESDEDGITETNIASSRSLEDVKKAKELLDLGAISQEEFDIIKAQALGVKIQPNVVQKEKAKISTTQPISENPKHEKLYERVTPVPDAQPIKKGNRKSLLYATISLVVLVLVFFFVKHFTGSSEYETVLAEAPSEAVQSSTNDDSAQAEQGVLADRSHNESSEGFSESNSTNFLTTPTGERYKMVTVQVPNHDEQGTTSEIEFIGPVEGIYFKDDMYISIQYEGDRILVSSWSGQEQKSKEEAFITSKGLLSFGGQEFDYDRFDESIADVRGLTLTNSAGEVFYWYYDH